MSMMTLYIPIWLYSNCRLQLRVTQLLHFTFQSGYIQMHSSFRPLTEWTCLYIPIWLYSNGTKWYSYTIIYNFTFQSGYIQIFVKLFECILPLYFTFQSGYIQIGLHGRLNYYPYRLYIPIWLYSNYTIDYLTIPISFLYIPIWLYSNITCTCCLIV